MRSAFNLGWIYPNLVTIKPSSAQIQQSFAQILPHLLVFAQIQPHLALFNLDPANPSSPPWSSYHVLLSSTQIWQRSIYRHSFIGSNSNWLIIHRSLIWLNPWWLAADGGSQLLPPHLRESEPSWAQSWPMGSLIFKIKHEELDIQIL